MTNFEQFKRDFKRELLVKVIIDLKYGKISHARAVRIAQDIVAIFEEQNPTQVFAKINKMAETKPEVLDIFIKRINEYENRDREARLAQIHVYLAPKVQEKGGENNGIN